MSNQRRLYVSMITSVLLIAVVTIVAADDMSMDQNPGTTAQPAEVIVCMDEELQEETPLSEVAVFGLENEEANEETEDEKAEVSNEEDKASVEAEVNAETEVNIETEVNVETEASVETEMPEAAEPETEGFESIPENVSWVEPEEYESMAAVTSTDIWVQIYEDLMYGEQTAEKLALIETVETKAEELALKSSPTDHIVNYHGTKYAISDEEYQVLLRIVESEAPCEDIEGRMLVANVVLNRVHAKQFPDTISEVVFQKGQFAPVSDGMYYKRTVTEKTVEAVERVLAGEDNSQGALYFVARGLASKEGLRFFDEKLEKLFKHGVHTFYAEK